ncbi:hypothetical protein ACSQ67_011617 [Phaseolus vulgaris]
MSTLESSPRSVSSPRLVSQESSTIIEGTREVTSGDQISPFGGCVLEGRWEYVIPAYRNYNEYHKIRINESEALHSHVVVNDGKVELVNTLVGAILSHEGREVCIIGENGERKDLIRVRNNNGETPIFRAVLTGRTKAFVYLLDVSKDLDVSLTNDHEDTILHQAIWREFFGKLLNLLNLYLVPSIYIDVQSF